MKVQRMIKRLRAKSSLTLRDVAMLVLGAFVAVIGVRMAYDKKDTVVPLAANATQISSPWIPDTVKHWQPIITEMAKKYDLDPNLIAIIMTLESGGYANAESHVGAQGLMQIMPPTAKDIARQHLKQPRTNYDIMDPKTNIEFGTAYLSYLRNEFGSAKQDHNWNTTVELIAAGYNGGPGNAAKLEKGLGLKSAETLSYSRDAYNMWRERNAPSSLTYQRWLERGGASLIEKAQRQ